METDSNINLTEILQNKKELKTNGQCSSILTDKDENYIIKEIKLTRYITFDDIFKEIEIQQKAQEFEVAPKLHGYKIENNKVYIIMEKIKGFGFEDLTTFYKKASEKKIPIDEKLKTNIAKAITILYNEGIYHLDLHSNNIFISESNDVKIIDYGLSEIFKGEGSEKNTTSKQPYIHRVIEIIGSNDYLDLTKYIDKNGEYINDEKKIDDENRTIQGGRTRKKNQTKKIEKRKTNKSKKTKNHKRNTRKRVKRKQI